MSGSSSVGGGSDPTGDYDYHLQDTYADTQDSIDKKFKASLADTHNKLQGYEVGVAHGGFDADQIRAG